eukprot:Gb_22046 [translate_table: standard]
MDRMARKGCICGICENVNLPSACTACVNYRLNQKYKLLKLFQQERDNLHKRLQSNLMAKRDADEQRHWRMIHDEKIAQLKKRLNLKKHQLLQEKAKLEEKNHEVNSRNTPLEETFVVLDKSQTEHLKKNYPDVICTQSLGHMAISVKLLQMQSMAIKQLRKIFPLCRVNVGGDKKDGSSAKQYDQICNVRLPRGIDPHSVPSEELAASLGYMVQLLNLVVRYLFAPLLVNCGFGASCSRVWQRASYWDSRPASRSKEYPLFIPRQNCCAASEENSLSDRSDSNFGVASMESPRRPPLDSIGSSSFNYGTSSQHSTETHKDLQKGISLLKKSVACVTAYCYNSYSMSARTDMSTFQAFENMLCFLSSNNAWNILSSKEDESSSRRQMQQPIRFIANDPSVAYSGIFSSSLEESKHAKVIEKFGNTDGSSHVTSFLYTNEVSDFGRAESLVDGWDIVEHPTLPPPPSHSEDVEHWTRAMFIDANKR